MLLLPGKGQVSMKGFDQYMFSFNFLTLEIQFPNELHIDILNLSSLASVRMKGTCVNYCLTEKNE